jgi:hypothetical protein
MKETVLFGILIKDFFPCLRWPNPTEYKTAFFLQKAIALPYLVTFFFLKLLVKVLAIHPF